MNIKDIYDLQDKVLSHIFSWEEILDAAHKKEIFSDDDLIIRLKSFPKELFNNIIIVDKNFLNNFDKEFPVIIDEIYYKKYHSKIESI